MHAMGLSLVVFPILLVLFALSALFLGGQGKALAGMALLALMLFLFLGVSRPSARHAPAVVLPPPAIEVQPELK